MEKATVVIPAFNEEKHIRKVIRAAKTALQLGMVSDIVVVNDGSKDSTARIATDEGVKVISYETNMGKGFAVFQGFKYCLKNKSAIMVTLDADITNPDALKIGKLVNELRENQKAPMVIGGYSRRNLDQEIFVSGQRALRIKALANFFKSHKQQDRIMMASGYGVEVFLNHALRGYKLGKNEFETRPRINNPEMQEIMVHFAALSVLAARDRRRQMASQRRQRIATRSLKA